MTNEEDKGHAAREEMDKTTGETKMRQQERRLQERNEADHRRQGLD